MHPVLFTIGSFPVGTYGVLMALAAAASIGLAQVLAPGAGIEAAKMVDLFVYSLLAAFIGAKGALFIVDFRGLSADPGRFLMENMRSFGVFYGGLVAAAVTAAIILKRGKIPLRPAADVTVVCLALGQSMGRWGCFFAGCCYGKPTSLPWGMVFPAVPICADGTRIHPWPLYASAADLAIFAILLFMFRRRHAPGNVFLAYVLLYAVARGLLEFLRGDEAGRLYFGGRVSIPQIVAVAAIVAVFTVLVLRRRRRKVSGYNGPQDKPCPARRR